MKFKALLLILILCFNAPAYAVEVLYFKPVKTNKEKLLTAFLVKQSPEYANTDFLMAKVDLNNDSLDEYILKPNNQILCASKKPCPHYVMALVKYKPIILGVYKAHKIVVLDNDSFGVRDLHVYENPLNNFKYKVFRWNPYASQYEAEQKE